MSLNPAVKELHEPVASGAYMILLEKIRKQTEKAAQWAVDHLGADQAHYMPQMTVFSMLYNESTGFNKQLKGILVSEHFKTIGPDAGFDAAKSFLESMKTIKPLDVNTLSVEHIARAILSVDGQSQANLLNNATDSMNAERKQIFQQELAKHKDRSDNMGSLARLFEQVFSINLTQISSNKHVSSPKLSM